MLLPTSVYRSPIACGDQDHATSHGRMARLVSIRYFLSSLAALVQLDRLRADDKLPGHVCLFKRDGHCT